MCRNVIGKSPLGMPVCMGMHAGKLVCVLNRDAYRNAGRVWLLAGVVGMHSRWVARMLFSLPEPEEVIRRAFRERSGSLESLLSIR